jgi:hypothetical protein
VERHNLCLGLQVVVLQQTLLDDQIAVLSLGREPLTYLNEADGRVSMIAAGRDYSRHRDAGGRLRQAK